MDFLTEQRLLFASERYDEIYGYFKDTYKIKYQHLFLICATIGFKYNKQLSYKKGKSQFRTNYFSTKERSVLYSLLLTNEETRQSIERFEDEKFQSKATNIITEYAEGGMEILVTKVFFANWNEEAIIGSRLNTRHKDFDYELLSFVKQELDQDPF